MNDFLAELDNVGEEVFDVNLEDASEGTSKYYVPPGDYEVKVIALEKKDSSKGDPMFVLDFSVMVGPEQGKELRLYLVQTSAAGWKLLQVLRALELTDGKDGKKAAFTKSKVIGRAAKITVKDGTYNDMKKSEIKTVARHPKGPDAFVTPF